LLNTEKRNKLFIKSLPIYTKIRDNGPVKFGLESSIKNSLIADGCVVDGKVENCILCRGVKIGKGAVVKNSIIMQDTVIGSKCSINSVITDKNVEIGEGKVLTGSESYPIYIGKKAKI
jgi:glucose-1-phosphate adenylyltransferase